MNCSTHRRLATVALAMAALAIFAIPEQAQARRRGLGLPLIIINTGEEIKRVGSLPTDIFEDEAEAAEIAGWSLGWKYSHFGILWADFACWDKELVAFQGNSYAPLPLEIRTDLGPRYPFSACDRNLWNKYGWLALTSMIGLGIYSKFQGE